MYLLLPQHVSTSIHAGSSGCRGMLTNDYAVFASAFLSFQAIHCYNSVFFTMGWFGKTVKLEKPNYHHDCIWLDSFHWHTRDWAALDGELVLLTLVQIVSHRSLTPVVWASQLLLSSISSACDHLVNMVATPLPSIKEGILPFLE